MQENKQKIVLCGGCFWCTEAVYQELRGVLSVTSGYTGGTKSNPTYLEVSSGDTGHTEGIEVTYDSSIISTQDIITVFFATHDPTTPNRQGADVGTQYRSALFYTNEEQLLLTKEIISDIESGEDSKKVVTEVLPLEIFYKAEDYHQEYYKINKKRNPYCEVVINPKLEKLQERFAELLNES